MKKILVTGGMGYIGSHTIIELLKHRGWEIYSLDNFVNSKLITQRRIEKAGGKKVRNFNIDLCDLAKLRSVFRKIGKVHGIIHFAALKSVEESMQKPFLYYQNNIYSLLNLLECCREFRVRHFIYSSSCSIYGDIPPEHQPVDENTIPLPAKSPYAHSKLIGEEILKQFYPHIGMKAVSLRYFNPAGADHSGSIGEDPIKKIRNLVNEITYTAAVKKRKAITVFGNDYSTRDGTCIRDYIHVSDIARAHVNALLYLEGLDKLQSRKQLGHYEVFNLGTGNGITVLEMIQAFEKISEVKITKVFSRRRPGDVMSVYSNNHKASRVLSWEPQLGTEEILKTAWEWELGKNK